jgi:ribosomal protein L21E
MLYMLDWRAGRVRNVPGYGKGASMVTVTANFSKGEKVVVLRPGYRGRSGRVVGPTKDAKRLIVNVEGGFRVAVLPEELQSSKIETGGKVK